MVHVTQSDPLHVMCSVPGVCNAYLPEDTTLDRFLWVVNYLTQQGFYIILDNQFNLDQTATYNTGLWLSRVWTILVSGRKATFCAGAALPRGTMLAHSRLELGVNFSSAHKSYMGASP